MNPQRRPNRGRIDPRTNRSDRRRRRTRPRSRKIRLERLVVVAFAPVEPPSPPGRRRRTEVVQLPPQTPQRVASQPQRLVAETGVLHRLRDQRLQIRPNPRRQPSHALPERKQLVRPGTATGRHPTIARTIPGRGRSRSRAHAPESPVIPHWHPPGLRILPKIYHMARARAGRRLQRRSDPIESNRIGAGVKKARGWKPVSDRSPSPRPGRGGRGGAGGVRAG